MNLAEPGRHMKSVELCLVAVLSACVGEVPPREFPDPPVDPAGLVTSPRHGDGRRSDALVVDGFYELPGATVVVERWDTIGRSWVAAGTGETAATGVTDADATLYPFRIAVALPAAAWPAGGLASLRARIGDRALTSIDRDPETERCLADRPTWRERIASCASGLPAITLLDTAVLPPAAAHRYLDAKGTSTPDDTAAYYLAIGAPATLGAFLATYGLDDPSVPTLTYYNAGDLATGREIRCKTHASAAGTGVACTTFNYGVFGSAAADALELAVAGRASGTGAGSFANVSMIYDPPITAPNAVRFLVYNTAGTLQTQAPLDTRGDNPSIPNNCINCHGSDSSYDVATNTVRGARFLPFDPSAFVFSDRSPVTRRDQEDAMRALNQTFLAAAPTDVLAETVRGWYGGGEILQGVADTQVVPAAWREPGAASLYRNVIAASCRACHASRSDDLAFATPAHVRARSAQIVAAVCGPSADARHAMPSAEASLAGFWSGPARAYLAGFLGPEAVGACTPRAP